MNALILNRSAGLGSPDNLPRTLQQDLLRRLELSTLRLEGRRPDGDGDPGVVAASSASAAAHYGGVNAIAIDKFEGK
jgi:hypothetical protein